MSNTTPVPSPDAGTEAATNGSGGNQGSAASQTPQPQGASSEAASTEPHRGDILARIRTEPEFAAEQFRHQQSRATKAEAKLREMESRLGTKLVSSYLERGATGDVIATALDEYQVLATDPLVQKALAAYRQTGEFKLAPSSASSRDEGGSQEVLEEDYLTDTERALAKRNDELEARLKGLEQRLTETGSNFGAQALTSHLDRIFTDRRLTGDRAQQVQEKLLQQIETWRNQGEAGAAALRDLQHPQRGRKTVEVLVNEALGWDGMRELVREEVLREERARAGMMTDGPSEFGTTGDEEPPGDFDTVEEAIRAARARPEVLSRY